MKTDNELIAEFMKNHAINSPHLKDPKQLEYNTSWDWLIPVVEKIVRTNHYKVQRNNNNIADALLAVDIDILYKSVVEFIKWYNENKK